MIYLLKNKITNQYLRITHIIINCDDEDEYIFSESPNEPIWCTTKIEDIEYILSEKYSPSRKTDFPRIPSYINIKNYIIE
jgi:hypothetical protein